MAAVLKRYGFDELDQFVEKFVSSYYLSAAQLGMTKALLFLHSKLPEYPPPPLAGEASKHWTEKQRRWFFWALKEGKVEAEYDRTGDLGRMFTTDVRRVGASVLGAIGTANPYAPWVVGPDKSEAITVGGVEMYQAAIHKDRWWQFVKVVKGNLPEAYEVMADEVFGYLEEQFYGQP